MATPRERSDFSEAVAAQVRAERAAAGITQAEVVRRSGLSRSTYLRIESGAHIADTTQLARICGVYGLALSAFFERVEDRVASVATDEHERLRGIPLASHAQAAALRASTLEDEATVPSDERR